MRRRFFLIVLGFLAITILLVSVLQQFYVRAEQNRVNEQRLETIASSLIASGLSVDLIDNLESTDDLIHDLLGDERVDLLINIYSSDGKLLAQNLTASKISLPLNLNLQWQDYISDGRKVRVLNLLKDDLIIQVGSFVDPALSSSRVSLNQYFFSFLCLVSLLMLSVAYLSSQALFRPLRKLTRELEQMSAQLDHKLGQPLSEFVVAPELLKFSNESKSKDEFEQLCQQLKLFLERLGNYTRSFNAQTAILTHELKTPLTILKNYLDELRRAPNLEAAQKHGTDAIEEVDNLTSLINDYLQWSVLSSNPSQPAELYAIHLAEIVQRLVEALNRNHNNRIELRGTGRPTVFAGPQHLDQLISNILSNALNYSPVDRRVVCELTENSLIVTDEGAGIPADVLEHLGEPFNRGMMKLSRSSGLGLAWSKALAEKYGWKLIIDAKSSGTIVKVAFE